jgi:hypothetical protein
MHSLDELEQRIATALDRIGKGLEDLPKAATPVPAAIDTSDLQMALDEERMLTAQLNERLRAVKEKDAQSQAQFSAKIDQMTQQLDAQGAELKRMRNTTVQLREVLRILRDASATGVADPHLVNRAMQAELEALRATRMTEVAEMDEILAELAPLIEEVREDA